MAGGMLASLSAVSAKPKEPAASQHAASSSLMNLSDDPSSSADEAKIIPNKASAGHKRVPLKDATMNRLERQDVKLKAKISSSRQRNEHPLKMNAAPKPSVLVAVATTNDIMTTPRNSNPEMLSSPSSNLSSVADDTLTPPPLTSVKVKKSELETTSISPISFAGLPLSTPTPAKVEVVDIGNKDNHDNEDEEESYVQSKDDSSEESHEESNASSNIESTNKHQEEACSSSSSITNEEIAANPRIVINRKIAKDFSGKAYVGTVVGYDDAFWQVDYVDGDGEDFSYAELMSGLDYFEELERDGNIPSINECDENTSCEQSLCDDEDANESSDDDECFDEEETDDDEDYSIEQESDSEDELEIDDGVDSEMQNGKPRGKKVGSKPKLASKTQLKADIQSVDNSSTVHAAVDTSETSVDDETNTSDETNDSDPVAVEVQPEGEVTGTHDDNCFDDGDATDYDLAGITTEPSVEMKEPTSIAESDVQMKDEVTSLDPVEIQEECLEVEATEQQDETDMASEKANIDKGVFEEATIVQEKPAALEKDSNGNSTTGEDEPTTLELFAVVDRIFLESDADKVTVKDVKNFVAAHFGLPRVQKEMKQAIKNRLIDLIQVNVQPMGATNEHATEGDDSEGYDPDGRDGTVIAETESRSIVSAEVESSSGSEASFSCDVSHVPNNSHGDSLSASASFGNDDDRMDMSGTLFQNLSPEFSIHSRTDENGSKVNDFMRTNSVSSPAIAANAKPRSRSVVVKGKWSLGPEIGVGSFGRVHTGLNAVNGSKYICYVWILT